MEEQEPNVEILEGEEGQNEDQLEVIKLDNEGGIDGLVDKKGEDEVEEGGEHEGGENEEGKEVEDDEGEEGQEIEVSQDR